MSSALDLWDAKFKRRGEGDALRLWDRLYEPKTPLQGQAQENIDRLKAGLGGAFRGDLPLEEKPPLTERQRQAQENIGRLVEEILTKGAEHLDVSKIVQERVAETLPGLVEGMVFPAAAIMRETRAAGEEAKETGVFPRDVPQRALKRFAGETKEALSHPADRPEEFIGTLGTLVSMLAGLGAGMKGPVKAPKMRGGLGAIIEAIKAELPPEALIPTPEAPIPVAQPKMPPVLRRRAPEYPIRAPEGLKARLEPARMPQEPRPAPEPTITPAPPEIVEPRAAGAAPEIAGLIKKIKEAIPRGKAGPVKVEPEMVELTPEMRQQVESFRSQVAEARAGKRIWTEEGQVIGEESTFPVKNMPGDRKAQLYVLDKVLEGKALTSGKSQEIWKRFRAEIEQNPPGQEQAFQATFDKIEELRRQDVFGPKKAKKDAPKVEEEPEFKLGEEAEPEFSLEQGRPGSADAQRIVDQARQVYGKGARDALGRQLEALKRDPTSDKPLVDATKQAIDILTDPHATGETPFSMGSYQAPSGRPIEGPELLQIAREVLGKYPRVVERLRSKAMMDVRGKFSPKRGQITLKARQPVEDLMSTFAHEIGHAVDWIPDKTLKRGNILGHIAALKTYLKRSIGELPATPDAAGGLTRADIMAELKELTRQWHPFDPAADPKFTKYRHSPSELYADAMSVLLRDPALMQSAAPKMWDAWHAYLQRRPAALAAYEDVQARLGNPAEIQRNRLEADRASMKRASQVRERWMAGARQVPEKIVRTILRGLMESQESSLSAIRSVARRMPQVAARVKGAIEAIPYIPSEVELMGRDLDGIRAGLDKAGASFDDLGVYLKARRIQMEREPRGVVANPLGDTAKTASERMTALERDLGQDKFTAVANAALEFDKWHQHTIDKLSKYGMLSADQIKMMRTSPYYAKFKVLEFLEQAAGKGEGARIHRQLGTMREVDHPAVATLFGDSSMIRAATINEAKLEMADLLSQAGQAPRARTRWSEDAKGHVPLPPKDPKLDIFSVMRKGKMEHYYLDRHIVAEFAFNPGRATALAHGWQYLIQPVRNLMVRWNPGWMVANPFRDFLSTVKNLPELRVRDIPAFAVSYGKAAKQVRGYQKGQVGESMRELIEGKALFPHRQYVAEDIIMDSALDRFLANYAVNPSPSHGAGPMRALERAYHYIDGKMETAGQLSDLTTKVAGYEWAKAAGTRSPAELLSLVRNRIGTPNVMRTGAWHRFTNSTLMFSNVGKEGFRGSWASFRENPRAYLWKTFVVTAVPKLILWGASKWGSDEEKRIIAGLSEYRKRMTQPIPLWLTKQGKSVAIILPQDHMGQLIGSVLWDTLEGHWREIPKHIQGQQPYQLHPLLQVAHDAYKAAVLGINPVDDYRGQPIIRQEVWESGDKPTMIREFGRSAWSELGLSMLFDFRYHPPDEGATQQILRAFPFNTLGRYVHIGDAGIGEKIYEAGTEAREEEAKRNLDITGQLDEEIGKGEGADLDALMEQMTEGGLIEDTSAARRGFNERVERRTIKSDASRVAQIIASSPTNREKQAKIEEARRTMLPAEFDRLMAELEKYGVKHE